MGYVITDDTMLDDSLGALADGSIVSVNAYTDPVTGQLVATRLTAAASVFLPVVRVQ